MEAATQGFEGHKPAAKFPSQSNLPELMLAYLRANNFSNVPADMFSSMKRLTRLDISRTDLKNLPASIGSLERLEYLEAYENPSLKGLPNATGNLKQLKKLYLAETNITQFPASLGSLNGLTTLDLSSLGLTALPKPICSWKNLTKLGLQGNDLRDIPPCFANLERLTTYGKLSVVDLFGDCSNIRLQYNETHPGYQKLRRLLVGEWRKKCSCSSYARTSCTCGNRGPNCATWMKGEHGPCPVSCKSKEEEQICLENM